MCLPVLIFILLSDHLLHMYWFQNIFQIPSRWFEFVHLCQEGIVFVAMYMGLYSFFSNNCFTRVSRRLVNSFSYSNRIFWSRENVITKCKNKQIRAKRFRLYIFSKHCDLWNQQYIFALGEVVASKIKCIIKI